MISRHGFSRVLGAAIGGLLGKFGLAFLAIAAIEFAFLNTIIVSSSPESPAGAIRTYVTSDVATAYTIT